MRAIDWLVCTRYCSFPNSDNYTMVMSDVNIRDRRRVHENPLYYFCNFSEN